MPSGDVRANSDKFIFLKLSFNLGGCNVEVKNLMTNKEQPEIAGERPRIEEVEAGEYWWCACGRSQEQPFCDGSHEGTSFEPIRFEVKTTRRIAWCLCKRSKKSPICDGSHNRLDQT